MFGEDGMKAYSKANASQCVRMGDEVATLIDLGACGGEVGTREIPRQVARYDASSHLKLLLHACFSLASNHSGISNRSDTNARCLKQIIFAL